MTSPWNEKMIMRVSRRPRVVIFPNFGIKLFSK